MKSVAAAPLLGLELGYHFRARERTFKPSWVEAGAEFRLRWLCSAIEPPMAAWEMAALLLRGGGRSARLSPAETGNSGRFKFKFRFKLTTTGEPGCWSWCHLNVPKSSRLFLRSNVPLQTFQAHLLPQTLTRVMASSCNF